MNQQRVDRVLAQLAAKGLNQALFCDPLSIWYLTGYYTEPHERFFALYLTSRSDAPTATLFCNRLFPDAREFCDNVVLFFDTEDPIPLVAAVYDASSALGVDKDLTARWLLPLIGSGAASNFVLASDAVDNTRSIKDEQEQDIMRTASALNDQAMDWLAVQVYEGVTEEQVASDLLNEYKRLGAEGYSFTPIVSFGANTADPHHEPDQTVFHEGDLVLYDVGCKYEWYCSDMTRTFFTAEPTDHQREVYETVRRANEAAEAIVRPGVTFAEIDRAARSIIEDAGYGPYFTHRLGHQIGLAVHEPGDVSSSHDEPVQAGQIFSIEPGIYLPDGTGVRIEDLVLVTENGCEVLNHYPHDLCVLKLREESILESFYRR